MDELAKLLAAVNRARQRNVSEQEIDNFLQVERGMTVAELETQVRAQVEAAAQQPQEERLAAAEAAAAQQETSKPGDVLAAAGSGASFGLLDEALSGLGLSMGNPVLGEMGEAVRQRTDRLRRTNPKQALAAEVLGGVAVPGAGAMKLAARGAGLLPQIGRGVGVGFGSGLLSAAGEAESVEEFKEIAPAIVGGSSVVGGLLPVAGVASGVGRAVGSFFAPKTAGKRIVADEIRKAASRAGLSPKDFVKRFKELRGLRPNEAVPADVAEAFRGLAKGIRGATDETIGEAIDAVTGRPLGAPSRLAEDLRNLGGFGDEAAEEAQAVARKRLSAKGKELFSPFDDIDIDPGADINLSELLRNPDVAAVWNRVRPLTDKGNPKFQHFQALRSRLIGEAEEANRKGNHALGAHLRDASDNITQRIEEAVPGFRAANQKFAQSARTVEAFDEGAKAVKKGLPGRSVEKQIAELRVRAGPEADAAVEAFRHGAVDEKLMQLVNRQITGNVGAKLTKKAGEEQARALRQLFPSREAFEEFTARALAEDKFTVLNNIANGVVGDITEGSAALRSGRTAGFWGAKAAMLNYLAKPSPDLIRSIADELVEALLTPGPESMQKVAGILSARAAFRPALDLAVSAGSGTALTDFLQGISNRQEQPEP